MPLLPLAFFISGAVHAEVPLLSSDGLKTEATHIVVGKVRAVYSTTTKSKDWEDTNSVAELSVLNVEKGGLVTGSDVIYAHFWNKKWIGKGKPEPHSGGHDGGHDGVKKGDVVRAHLVRKEGTYQVILPNGFASLKPDEIKEVSKSKSSEAAAATELAEVQGKWVRTIRTDSGTFKVVKEHKGNKTTVTFMDSEGRIVQAKSSEFRLENSGKVRIFTFFNNLITAGPQKGRTNKEPHSYIYRVVGDTFVEVNGLLIDDDAAPVAFTWKRVKE